MAAGPRQHHTACVGGAFQRSGLSYYQQSGIVSKLSATEGVEACRIEFNSASDCESIESSECLLSVTGRLICLNANVIFLNVCVGRLGSKRAISDRSGSGNKVAKYGSISKSGRERVRVSLLRLCTLIDLFH